MAFEVITKNSDAVTNTYISAYAEKLLFHYI